MLINEWNEELFAGENYSCTFMHLPSITLDYCSGLQCILLHTANQDDKGEKEIHQNSLDSRVRRGSARI